MLPTFYYLINQECVAYNGTQGASNSHTRTRCPNPSPFEIQASHRRCLKLRGRLEDHYAATCNRTRAEGVRSCCCVAGKPVNDAPISAHDNPLYRELLETTSRCNSASPSRRHSSIESLVLSSLLPESQAETGRQMRRSGKIQVFLNRAKSHESSVVSHCFSRKWTPRPSMLEHIFVETYRPCF